MIFKTLPLPDVNAVVNYSQMCGEVFVDTHGLSQTLLIFKLSQTLTALLQCMVG